MTRQVYALLGRRDEPTDAVEEYCRYLAAALLPHEIQLNIRRVPWKTRGWHEALRGLKLQSANWRGTWVFLQYTALAWSSRGFPFRFLRVLRILKSVGAHVGIVFHDVTPYSSPRLIDQLRYRAQLRVLRRGAENADCSVFTVPVEKISWLTKMHQKAAFIPVGPNLPFPDSFTPPRDAVFPTIGVFSITGGQPGERETRVILNAVRYATEKIGSLRLSVFGRHSELREDALHEGLRGLPVQVLVEGVVSAEQVVSRLSACNVLLFVRSGISTRRSSAIAGIAAGLPIVAYANAETAVPITDAGVLLVNSEHPEELGEGLVRVLSDNAFRKELAARSRAAYQAHFAWPAIAEKFSKILQSE